MARVLPSRPAPCRLHLCPRPPRVAPAPQQPRDHWPGLRLLPVARPVSLGISRPALPSCSPTGAALGLRPVHSPGDLPRDPCELWTHKTGVSARGRGPAAHLPQLRPSRLTPASVPPGARPVHRLFSTAGWPFDHWRYLLCAGSSDDAVPRHNLRPWRTDEPPFYVSGGLCSWGVILPAPGPSRCLGSVSRRPTGTVLPKHPPALPPCSTALLALPRAGLLKAEWRCSCACRPGDPRCRDPGGRPLSVSR